MLKYPAWLNQPTAVNGNGGCLARSFRLATLYGFS
jgi:hypothetical protein